ncbi:MAG: EamA family transporter [Candidatus Woesearchaeota archaeon]
MVNLLSIVLVLIGTVVGAVGALILKKGTTKYRLREMLFTKYFWSGVLLYVLSTVFYIIALRQEHLSVLYPIVSTTYLWTTILGVKFLGEKMNKWKYMGLVGIIVGVVLIGIGG